MALPLWGLRRFRYARYFGDGRYPTVPQYFVLTDRNTGTLLVDSSGSNLTITAQGSSRLDPLQSKFGGDSFHVTPGSETHTGNNANLILGTSAFCLEGWIRLDSSINAVTDRNWTWQWDNVTTSIGVEIRTGGDDPTKKYIRQRTPFTGSGTFLTEISNDRWYHVAQTREIIGSNQTVRLFLDGTLLQEVTEPTFDLTGATTEVFIGVQRGLSDIRALRGWIDEFRFVVGSPVYTSNFTPPSFPYTANSEAGTKLLYHFDQGNPLYRITAPAGVVTPVKIAAPTNADTKEDFMVVRNHQTIPPSWVNIFVNNGVLGFEPTRDNTRPPLVPDGGKQWLIVISSIGIDAMNPAGKFYGDDDAIYGEFEYS